MSEGHLAVGKPDEEGNFPVSHVRRVGAVPRPPISTIRNLDELDKLKQELGIDEVRYEGAPPPAGPPDDTGC